MHLESGEIIFGCTRRQNLLAVLGWVGLGPNFSTCNWLGWVWLGKLMSWIGSGHTKWTHEQLWSM